MKTNEPTELRLGKAFHKLIQVEWQREAEEDIYPERYVTKPNGRKGRVDVFVDDTDAKAPIAVVEVKATDWDRIKEKNVRRNFRRQIRQIWSYIESQIRHGEYVEGGEGKDVCPGIIFPKRPRNKQRMKLIEELFSEEGIPVVWHDETIEECKARQNSSETSEARPS
jgi:hypothetical protein